MSVWLPELDLPSDWRPTPVSRLPSWAEARRVSVDCETRDDGLFTLGPGVRRDRATHFVAGVSFKIEDGPAHYLPVAHAGGDNLPADHVWAYLRDQARACRGDVVGANLGYDVDWLEEYRVSFEQIGNPEPGRTHGYFRDVQVAEPLLDELQRSYSLENIALRHGLPGKSEEHLRRAIETWGLRGKGELWRLPARHVGAYAEGDVELPLLILRRQERMLDEQDLWRVWDLESRVLWALVRMRRRGIRVDETRLVAVEKYVEAEERKAGEKAGLEFGSCWEDETVLKCLERAIPGVRGMLPLTDGPKKRKEGETVAEFAERKAAKRRPSVSADALEGLDVEHPVLDLVLRTRRMNKIRTTFAASIRRFQIGWRIHCTYNQMRTGDSEKELEGAAYGRMASKNPNLTQQPARDKELGPMWRAIYVPEEGECYVAADYSQQEPRLTVHYAVLDGRPGAEEFAQRYRDDPKTDCYIPVAEAAGIERKPAKTIFLGVSYGMGGGKLCRDLGLPTLRQEDPEAHRAKMDDLRQRRHGDESFVIDPEALDFPGREGAELLRKFDELVPFVRGLAKRARRRAEEAGHVRTLSGRRCRFPRNRRDTSFDWTHKGLNRVIQGSAADQTKMAMVLLEEAGLRPRIQVHDEICLSGSREEAARAGEIMSRAVEVYSERYWGRRIDMLVPFKVDVAIEANWGACGD